MRKALLALLFASVSFAQAPSISSYGTQIYSSYSSATIYAVIANPIFDGNNNGASLTRVVIAPQPGADCGSGLDPTGTGGWIQQGTYAPNAPNASANDHDWILTGLTPSTTYHVCPQLYNGTNWVYPGGFITITTTAKTAASTIPIAPTVYAPSFPSIGTTVDCATNPTSGYCVDHTLENNNCTSDPSYGTGGNWSLAIDHALARRHSNNVGTVLSLKNSICRKHYAIHWTGFKIDGDNRGYTSQNVNDPDWVSLSAGAVTTDTGVTDSSYITYGAGLTSVLPEGSQVLFGNIGGSLPVGTPQWACTAGVIPGFTYYVHILSKNGGTNNAFSLYCGSAQANGGTYLPITATSSGSNIWYVNAARPTLSWIIIDGGVDDAHFVPFGSRVTPELGATTGGFSRDYATEFSRDDSNATVFVGDNDGTFDAPVGNLWFRGLQFTTGYGELSFDPGEIGPTLNINRSANNIVLDRNYIHFPYGSRVGDVGFIPNGHNIDIVGNYFDNLVAWGQSWNGLNGPAADGSGNILSPSSTLTLSSGAAGDNPANPKLRMPSGLNITETGAGSGGTYLIYADINGGLSVALPPGVSATCTGISTCNTFTADTFGGASYGSLGSFPSSSSSATGAVGIVYAIDPVFSTSNTCSNTENLFGPTFFNGVYNVGGGASTEYGTRFSPRSSGYICGARVYKQDSLAHHTFTLWSDSGTSLTSATTGTETASGYQTVTFGSPQAVTAGTVYRISFGSTGTVAYQGASPGPGPNQNWNLANYLGSNHGTLQMIAYYQADGGCDAAEHTTVPHLDTQYAILNSLSFSAVNNVLGNTIACGIINSGTFATYFGGPKRITSTTQWNPGGSGTNWLAAYQGPGPIHFQNNMIHAWGLTNHFDGAGGAGSHGSCYIPACTNGNNAIPNSPYFSGADFMLDRNFTWADLRYIETPINPATNSSDGNYYPGRQPWEWKAGNRIAIDGNLFEGAFQGTSSQGGVFEFDAVSTLQGITDVNVTNNEARHLNGFSLGPHPVVGGTPYPNQVVSRINFQNNLVWDIDAFLYTEPFTSNSPSGSFLIFNGGNEALKIDHNTIVGMNGQDTEIVDEREGRTADLVVTNNIMPATQQNSGYQTLFAWMSAPTYGPNGVDICGTLPGLSGGGTTVNTRLNFTCATSGNSAFNHNAIIPGANNPNTTPVTSLMSYATLGAWFPNGTVSAPVTADSSFTQSVNFNNDLGNYTNSNIGYWKFNPSSLSSDITGDGGNIFRLNGTGNYCSGCTYPAGDGRDMGADPEALITHQGLVQAINITGITHTNAVVNFVAPDTNACRVDYGTDPTIVTFLSITPAGGNRVQSASIGSLTAGTTYYFRIDCQSAPGEPTGTFATQ